MKANEVKTGVVYSKEKANKKGIVISIAHQYRKPSYLIHRDREEIVETVKGANGGFLVLEAHPSYPSEQLIEDAQTILELGIPEPGKVWPYVPKEHRKWNYGDRNDAPRHEYPAHLPLKGVAIPNFHSTTQVHPYLNLWMPRQFKGEWDVVEADRIAFEKAAAEQDRQRALRKEQETKRAHELIQGVNRLSLEGVTNHHLETFHDHRNSTSHVVISNDLLEALIKKAGAAS